MIKSHQQQIDLRLPRIGIIRKGAPKPRKAPAATSTISASTAPIPSSPPPGTTPSAPNPKMCIRDRNSAPLRHDR